MRATRLIAAHPKTIAVPVVGALVILGISLSGAWAAPGPTDPPALPDGPVVVRDVGTKQLVTIQRSELAQLQTNRRAELDAAKDERPQVYYFMNGRVESSPVTVTRTVTPDPSGGTRELVTIGPMQSK
jgi:hypothetical protein